jgi:secreted trypsin-like serine protease
MKFYQNLILSAIIGFFGYSESATVLESNSTTAQKQLSIIGGMAASPGQFPYVVSLLMLSFEDEWYCNGVLIYYNYVITTAYCVDYAFEIIVLLGEYDMSAMYPATRSKSRVRIFARQWTFHENYLYDYGYDIGIIQLPLYAVANLNITTAPMGAINVTNFYMGKSGTVAGWGYKELELFTNYFLIKMIMNIIELFFFTERILQQII